MKEKLICSECRKPAKELYIVRIDAAICVRCLTDEDVARYPEFAETLQRHQQFALPIEEAA